MRAQTGARLRVVDAVPGATERVVVISSRHDPAAPADPAQDALFRVFEGVLEADAADGGGGSGDGDGVVARLLVCRTQAGPVIGKRVLFGEGMKLVVGGWDG